MAHFYPGQDLSKPGYLKRCMLLNHEVFWFLVRNHNGNFYADGIGHSFHGFLVLAMDGSNVLSPNTQENIENYETSSRKGNKPRAALGLSCVHDVLNKMIVGSDVFRSNFDERAAAREQLAHIRDDIGLPLCCHHGSRLQFRAVVPPAEPAGDFLRCPVKGDRFLGRAESHGRDGFR